MKYDSKILKPHVFSLLLISLGVFFSSFNLITGKYLVTWDLYDYTLPQILFLKDSFAVGQFPLWNPFVLAGEALFTQPAVFPYGPINLFLATLPEFISTHYALELTLLLFTVIGGFGAYLLLIRLGVRPLIAMVGGVIYSQTAFGPLLGQPPLVTAIALFPWVLRSAHLQITDKSTWDQRSFLTSTLLLSFLLLSSYFAVSLYVLIFAFFWSLFFIYQTRDKLGASGIKVVFSKLILIGLSSLLIGAVYFLPAIFNRIYFYKDLLGDFLSPDLRLRGLVLAREQVVDIIRNERTLISTLFNLQHLSPHRATWTIGIGCYSTIIAFWGFAFAKRSPLTLFLSVSSVVTALYILGPSGPVFEFVYMFVPVLKNIRYPVFAFFLLQFCLIALASITLNTLFMSKSPEKYIGKSPYVFAALGIICMVMSYKSSIEYLFLSLVFVSLCTLSWFVKVRPKAFRRLGNNVLLPLTLLIVLLEVVYFVDSTEIYKGRATNIIEASSSRDSNFSLSSRFGQATYNKNLRALSSSKSYDYSSKQWILTKTPFSHGYSTSDSPQYWYLKSHRFLAEIFTTTKQIISTPLPLRSNSSSDAEYLQNTADLIPSNHFEGVYLSTLDDQPKSLDKDLTLCKVLSTSVTPNEISGTIQANGTCLLFVTNKYFPGWSVEVNGQEYELLKVNKLFMGTLLSAGQNKVSFKFSPVIFWVGAIVSLTSLLLLILITTALPALRTAISRAHPPKG